MQDRFKPSAQRKCALAGASFAAKRRDSVAKAFKGKVLIFEAGTAKVRSNDTDYMYRPHSAFAHLTGWGSSTVADSVLVIDARGAKPKSLLYFRETAGRDSDEFFANAAIGEFWVGARPSLKQVSALLGITTHPLSGYKTYLKSLPKQKVLNLNKNADLARFVSELRLIKDKFEIQEMRSAIAASVKGFEEVARSLKKAKGHPRGERVVEGVCLIEQTNREPIAHGHAAGIRFDSARQQLQHRGLAVAVAADDADAVALVHADRDGVKDLLGRKLEGDLFGSQ